jgi:aspartyl-tRNA synthetase
MLRYGSDKPDLRNPIEISDVGEHFRGQGFGLFARIVEGGGVVRAIPAPGAGARSRKFFDDMNEWARAQGHAGLGYINIKGGEAGGPIAKNLGEEATAKLVAALDLGPDDGVFFAAGKEGDAAKLAGARRGSSNSAGSSIFRCSNMTRTRRRSISATTPSRCRRASSRRWRR